MLSKYIRQVKFGLELVLISWGVFILDFFLPLDLNSFGLIPRDGLGMIGIISMPFLHGGFGHILGNSIGFLFLSALLIIFHPIRYRSILLQITLIAGITLWLFSPGRDIHVGASGVIFGMASFLIFAGIFSIRFLEIIAGMITVILYGLPLLIGLSPIKSDVSYSGHWFGLLSGIIIALVYSKYSNKKQE